MQTGLFYKPTDSFDDPLVQSDAPVSDRNLVPTIMEQAGVYSSAGATQGYSYSETTHENTPYRLFSNVIKEKEDIFWLMNYTVSGDAKNLDNWNLSSQRRSERNYWAQ